MKALSGCPVCLSSESNFWYQGSYKKGDKNQWRVVQCRKCGLGFVNPQPSWDELAPYYSADYDAYEPDHSAWKSDEETIATAKQSGEFRHVKVRPGMDILDVGCGGGYFLRITAALGANSEGIEPSEHGLANARKSGRPVYHGTIENYVDQHAGKSFDLITANHVLEHTPNPVDTLRLMSRLLKPDGMIWIAVPNAATPYGRALALKWHSAMPPIHLMQFTRESLAEAGRNAGLQVRSVTTYSLPSAVAATIRGYLRHKYLIPFRLSKHFKFIDDPIAPRVGKKQDERVEGEALLAEFTRSS
jgi:2-polyprenyl-3-methyl-5-hydroxy-6-metoxy-1,4-benzoquinol methylase